jgi:hypothetical protein
MEEMVRLSVLAVVGLLVWVLFFSLLVTRGINFAVRGARSGWVSSKVRPRVVRDYKGWLHAVIASYDRMRPLCCALDAQSR